MTENLYAINYSDDISSIYPGDLDGVGILSIIQNNILALYTHEVQVLHKISILIYGGAKLKGMLCTSVFELRHKQKTI